MITKKTICKRATATLEFEQGKSLFQSYANSLNFKLCFQNFEKELQQINVQYSSPTGALLLAYQLGEPIGCVGIRYLAEGIAELKRMYVLPEYRKQKIGQQLLELALKSAHELGYQKIRLDTLQDMVSAINLYRSHGFKEIKPYYDNPMEGAIYLEKGLG